MIVNGQLNPGKPADQLKFGWGGGVKLWVMAGVRRSELHQSGDALAGTLVSQIFQSYVDAGDVNPSHKYYGWFQEPQYVDEPGE